MHGHSSERWNDETMRQARRPGARLRRDDGHSVTRAANSSQAHHLHGSGIPHRRVSRMSKPAAQAAPPIPPRSSNLALWILIALLVVGIAGAGAWWFLQGPGADAHAAEPTATATRAPARYYALEPAFVVNLADAGAVRYLQADVQVMTRDEATGAALELHTPAIRNRLLLLFGQHTAAQLAQRSAKERLQEQALAEVRGVLRAERAPDKVEAVFFTSLVTQ
jgi:flagellar FliL protein